MKWIVSLAITMAFFALLLSSAAFVMSYSVYSQSESNARQEMCEKQNLMDFFECMKS